MPFERRHFWKSAMVILAMSSIALPPAIASMSRAERIRDTQLSDTLLGQFTPASGDKRLIERYMKLSSRSRTAFSFTPAVTDDGQKNRAITVVIRAQDNKSSAVRTAALAAGRTKAPIAIAPVAYDLGASVGFEKFVTPAVPRGTDIKHLPQARAPETRAKPSRLTTRLRSSSIDPTSGAERVNALGVDQSVDVVSSYRLTKNIDVTAGVRYKSEEAIEPLTDARRDSQAVYLGTAFRF